jgi:hypothetical protein
MCGIGGIGAQRNLLKVEHRVSDSSGQSKSRLHLRLQYIRGTAPHSCIQFIYDLLLFQTYCMNFGALLGMGCGKICLILAWVKRTGRPV